MISPSSRSAQREKAMLLHACRLRHTRAPPYSSTGRSHRTAELARPPLAAFDPGVDGAEGQLRLHIDCALYESGGRRHLVQLDGRPRHIAVRNIEVSIASAALCGGDGKGIFACSGCDHAQEPFGHRQRADQHDRNAAKLLAAPSKGQISTALALAPLARPPAGARADQPRACAAGERVGRIARPGV